MVDILYNINNIVATLPKGRMKGDVNGDGYVNNNDAVLILKNLAGLKDINSVEFWCADINGDGKADSTDATIVIGFESGSATGATLWSNMADYYGNWTWFKVNNTSGYFYYDIPVETITTESTVTVDTLAVDWITELECRNGVIRVHAERLPFEDVEIRILTGSKLTNI